MWNQLLNLVRQQATTDEIAGAALGLIEHGTDNDWQQTLAVLAALVGTLARQSLPEGEKEAVAAKACAAIDATKGHLLERDTAAALTVAAALIGAVAALEHTP